LQLGGLLLAVGVAPHAIAEEFHLKDGTKIQGKIVGYEKDAFRVETSFGFAIIYKDRIARIVFDEPAAAEAAAPKEKPEQTTKEATGGETRSAPEATSRASRVGSPALAAAPAPIVENVTGTEYVNHTYGFRLFKPPTWRSYPQLVRSQTPLVAALGTPDETTLLLIGHEISRGDVADYARGDERTLRQFYKDYRRVSERATTVAGFPAIERRFTGTAEERFWTGLAIYVAHGQHYFTFLGLTAAGEMTSLQETVLRKVTNSLEFLPRQESP
ncbi:MAG: hypothetical protein HYY26_02860, partial [Acidobacteria bacterium]|nr:hypothetical protein [Acidobacteriota bacterium]